MSISLMGYKDCQFQPLTLLIRSERHVEYVHILQVPLSVCQCVGSFGSRSLTTQGL